MIDQDSLRARAAEVQQRIGALRGVLDRRGDTAAFLVSRHNFAWLTAGASAHIVLSTETPVAGLLVTPDDVVAITSNIEATRLAGEELAGLPIEVITVPWSERNAMAAEVGQRLGGEPPPLATTRWISISGMNAASFRLSIAIG